MEMQKKKKLKNFDYISKYAKINISFSPSSHLSTFFANQKEISFIQWTFNNNQWACVAQFSGQSLAHCS